MACTYAEGKPAVSFKTNHNLYRCFRLLLIFGPSKAVSAKNIRTYTVDLGTKMMQAPFSTLFIFQKVTILRHDNPYDC